MNEENELTIPSLQSDASTVLSQTHLCPLIPSEIQIPSLHKSLDRQREGGTEQEEEVE